jgi:hypothetical protein
MFSASILLGVFIDIIIYKTTNKCYMIDSSKLSKLKSPCHQVLLIVIILFLIISLTAFPLFTGDVTKNWLYPNVKGYSIPLDIYRDLENILDKNNWLLLLPPKYTYILFNESGEFWGSGNPYPKLLGVPFISGLGGEYIPSHSNEYISWLYSLFTESNITIENIIKIFALNGIEYILIEKNIILGSKNDYKIYLSKFTDEDFFVLVRDYGNRAVFKINSSNGLVYLASKWAFYNASNYSSILNIIENYSFNDIKGLVLIDKNNNLVRKWLLSARTNPDGRLISLEVLSLSHFKIEAISNRYILLVLEMSYDPNWRVYVNGVELDESLHFKANGFGNGWLIPMSGRLTIEIKYDLNKYLSIYKYYVFGFLLYVFYKVISAFNFKYIFVARLSPRVRKFS